jgi:CubicO group peptidase (beta-lactamase class C family)
MMAGLLMITRLLDFISLRQRSRKRAWAVVAAVALCATGARAQSPVPDLDKIAQAAIAQERVVGASVLVARANKVVLNKGYGLADLGLEAPANAETVYHVVGPMMPFTGIAVMQLVERGKLSLDDDISKFIPEFPLQGHRVTVRQLLNHTSGIVDYHYLGDPIEATSRQPKALDEVMALYANKQWVNEPGKKWDWSISGFQLLVTILERVSRQSYQEYVAQNIVAPAGARAMTYCDDFTLIRGLAHAYRRVGDTQVMAHENGMAYNTDLRYCSSAGDLYRAWRAVQEKKLVKPETWKMMSTFEGAAERMSAQDPKMHYGLALTLNHEDDHRSIGQHGSLMGYSGSLYDFPEDQLTIVVLTNTEGQNAYAISRALARAVLGLSELPKPPPARPPIQLADRPVSSSEIKKLTGTESTGEPARFLCAISPHLSRVRRERTAHDSAARAGGRASVEAGRWQLRDALLGAHAHFFRYAERSSSGHVDGGPGRASTLWKSCG